MTAIGVVVFVGLAACRALCQQASDPTTANLPDAPAVQNPDPPADLRTFSDTSCLPPNTLATSIRTQVGWGGPACATAELHFDQGLRFDPGHFAYADELLRVGTTAAFPLRPLGSYHASVRNTLLGRATDAASSLVLIREDDGKRKLNTPYLLTVLTSAVAHSAYRPYWRRSATQPLSDFGSAVGSDAGMNVLHEFEPGILHLVKDHEPRFVSKIEGRARR